MVAPPITMPAANPILLSSTANPRHPGGAIPPSLPSIWRHIQGSSNWHHLLRPLHPVLRHELIRYARFVRSAYKSFDHDPSSRHYLRSKYPISSLLPQTGAFNSPYRVTKLLHATPAASSRAHCVGFVAVSDDPSLSSLGRRDILVSFRGTVTGAEWLTNLMSALTAARLGPSSSPRPGVKVESGFLALYTSAACRAPLLAEVSRIVTLHQSDELSVTLAGHSMGSSLAVLCGYDFAELGLNRLRPPAGRGASRTVPVTVYSYGGPRVGNPAFKARCEELGVKVLRVANVRDPVTKMPGVILNERLNGLPWGGGSCYSHVGVELALDFVDVKNYPACAHDLEAYIGWLEGGGEVVEEGRGDGGDGLLGKVRELFTSKMVDALWQRKKEEYCK